MHICEVLDIKPVAGEQTVFLDREKRELLDRYARLDKPGKEAVRAVAAVEFLRVSDADAFAAFSKKLDETDSPILEA